MVQYWPGPILAWAILAWYYTGLGYTGHGYTVPGTLHPVPGTPCTTYPPTPYPHYPSTHHPVPAPSWSTGYTVTRHVCWPDAVHQASFGLIRTGQADYLKHGIWQNWILKHGIWQNWILRHCVLLGGATVLNRFCTFLLRTVDFTHPRCEYLIIY